MSRYFSKEYIQIASKHMKRCLKKNIKKKKKRCLISLVIREMQTETTVRPHFTLRWLESDNHKCWQGCGRTGPQVHCWRKCKMVQSLIENGIKHRGPSNSTCSYYLRKLKTYSHQILYMNACSNTMHNSQKVETNQMSVNGWMNKQSLVYTRNGTLLGK